MPVQHARLEFMLLCRTYTYWDAYISTNMIISNVIMTKMLFRALTDPSVLRYTWHMHVNILLNLVACTANLLLIFRWAQSSQHTVWRGSTHSTACEVHVSYLEVRSSPIPSLLCAFVLVAALSVPSTADVQLLMGTYLDSYSTLRWYPARSSMQQQAQLIDHTHLREGS